MIQGVSGALISLRRFQKRNCKGISDGFSGDSRSSSGGIRQVRGLWDGSRKFQEGSRGCTKSFWNSRRRASWDFMMVNGGSMRFKVFLGVWGCFRWFKKCIGSSGDFQCVRKHFCLLQGASGGLNATPWISGRFQRGVKEFQRIPRGSKKLKKQLTGISGGYRTASKRSKAFQGDSNGFKRCQWGSRGSQWGFKEASRCFKDVSWGVLRFPQAHSVSDGSRLFYGSYGMFQITKKFPRVLGGVSACLRGYQRKLIIYVRVYVSNRPWEITGKALTFDNHYTRGAWYTLSSH